MYPSDKRPRLYASGAAKRREKKRLLDNAVAGTSGITGIKRFFSAPELDDETDDGNSIAVDGDAVLVPAAPEDEAAAEQPQQPGQVQELPVPELGLDLSVDNPTDRAHFQLGTLSTEMTTAVLRHGPCRPNGPFSLNAKYNRRIFSEKLYRAHSGAMQIERQWLCFSPTMQRPYCQSCWLFGDRSTPQREWANGVSGNPKNYGKKIILHEKTQAHLDASIAFGRWKAGQRIDHAQEQAIAAEATFWRKSLLRIINIIMTLSMMSLALRGHREHVADGDCYGGNFLALVAMQARFDPILQVG